MKRVGTVALTALLAIAAPVAAYAGPAQNPLDRFERTAGGRIYSPAVPASADDTGRVTVMVELAADPVAVVEATTRGELTKAQRQRLKADRKAAQDALKPAIAELGGEVRSQVQTAYNGVKVFIARKDVAALGELPGVKDIHPVRVFEPTNATTIPYLGVDRVWEDSGFTGDGVKVAIIDTGIDYTHATFGGPGTREAFQAADSADHQPADPALFGPDAPRVKGGWDFVGDDYNASETGSVPQPDPNPLDCNGHGTHVAGTTGGGGVNPDGSAYTGPYNASTPNIDFRVGPGVAPEVDLYALRVFGCSGSTDVTIEAIDWAADNDMDVINMSLGSSYGTKDDPTSVAATNAAATGIVVVASAGNSGPSPYLTGSPGTADGVISVAASDATESLPGATLTVGDQAIEAINANGASLPGGPLTIVTLKDDPATAEQEQLGCSADAFRKAGVVPGGNQIAVSIRGTCARVARAIYGQEAGAAAVVMVNSTNTLPPFEGPITENPDDGTPANVTIPFLGVRSSDGARLTGGAQLTLAAKNLVNPGFEGYGSFTSAGPRSGDSGLKPTVTAPGVSVASASVGTGSGARYLSGTSMAAPHVAGVAALGVQAHPGWSGQDVTAALVSTADPTDIKGYRLTRGGGLVDTAALVAASTFAYGDSADGDLPFREPTLSFGFAELGADFAAARTLTIVNEGESAQTFDVSYEPTPQSLPASVTFSAGRVTVPAGGTATVDVTVAVAATDIPSSLTGGHHGFREVSGNVVLTGDAQTHRLGALLVPRPATNVAGAIPGGRTAPKTPVKLVFTNAGAVLDARADLFTWGLQDAADQSIKAGFDLQAAGAQSFSYEGKSYLVFAVAMHDRFSNAASIEVDVLLDTNRDGKNDVAVFSYDSGAIRSGQHNGINEVFVYHFKTGALYASGFLATSPTDSSTVLLPVPVDLLGLQGQFRYSVASFYGDAWDQFTKRAGYDPAKKPLTDGGTVQVPAGGTVTVEASVDRAAFSATKSLGFLAVVYDNRAGAEAVLVPVK